VFYFLTLNAILVFKKKVKSLPERWVLYVKTQPFLHLDHTFQFVPWLFLSYVWTLLLSLGLWATKIRATDLALSGVPFRTPVNCDERGLARSSAESQRVVKTIGPLTEDQFDDLLIMDTLTVPLRRLPLNSTDVWSAHLKDLCHFSWLAQIPRLVEIIFIFIYLFILCSTTRPHDQYSKGCAFTF
jgi:hypothetical protein